MRKVLLATTLLSLGTNLAQAQEFATTPLSNLSSTMNPQKPAEHFVKAGAHFLRGVEIALQARYDYGLSEEMSGLPLLRLGIGENPDPKPIPDGVIKTTLLAVEEELSKAKSELTNAMDAEPFVANIKLGELWFDINSSGTRDEGEGLIDVMSTTAMLPEASKDAIIGFDNSDSYWLDAYASLLTGVSRAIRAYDPDKALTAVISSRKEFEADSFAGEMVPSSFIDAASVVISTLRNEPDKDLGKQSHTSFINVINSNKRFLESLELETDDENEWIPNHKQKITIGEFAFRDIGQPQFDEAPEDAISEEKPMAPRTTGLTTREMASWRDVLQDGEDLLTGKKLLAFWRSSKGINVNKVFYDLRPIHLDEWIQGRGAIPYLENGVIADAGALEAFTSLFPGSAGLMAFWLN